MAPTPQEYRPCLEPKEQKTAPPFNGESIVISGMSGLFPSSKNVNDFSQILYDKSNPVNNDNLRWTLKHPQLSEYVGKVPGLDRFDAQFFMVHKRLGEAMDPMARKVLEQSYQAIYDAGLSPKHLNGKKVGVYIAAAFSYSEAVGFFNTVSKTGYGITGTSKTMYANRISYWLNAKGPSMTIDDACCGSVVALAEACRAINSGIIESAIVGGTNACLAPHSLVHYNRCIKISQDGTTKSFDQNADGCCKSEAISVLFIQKAKHALRAYAEVIHVNNEFISTLSGENGQIFGFVRNPSTTAQFLKKFYSEAGVSPRNVEYIEACGSATPEADKAELQSIEKVFCDNRSDPLLVGSVISNIGFTDAASGATAITKVLLGYHNGLIASNLHCQTPRQDIAAIQDGRMCIVTDHQPFRGTYAAVNCLSFTGVNSHVLLRGCSKPKDLAKYTTSMPRLLTISARQEDYLKDIFEDLKLRPIDAEELALLQNIHSTTVSGHLGRGYIILDTDEAQNTVSLSEDIKHSDEMDRPLWFVYSGMGSQWAGMGAQLMRIPIFAAAIERCRKVLEPKGIDIVHIITSPDRTIFDNVLNSFLGIAAIQIGITDVLTALGLRPDKIIGHSVGELGCAYADGCLTAEEMIQSAYSRGKASNDAILTRGAMAAVGLGYNELVKVCPQSIDIACHNSSTSCTISGPEESVRHFVATLTDNGIFAKEVPCANIAYHSRYIANAGPYLLELLTNIIEPRTRSERWLSTSVPQDRWKEPCAKYCSAEYLTNNLLSPVLFEETCSLIPSNAVLVEIAPHGLLQAILKRALPETCKNIPLTQRGHKDNAHFLLDAIGKLYIEGYNPQVQAIYPKVKFPVSTGTPHLAHFAQWNHSESWPTGSLGDLHYKSAASCNILISIHDEEHYYLTGNVVQGKILFPFAGALVAVWDTLAMTLGFSKKKVSVRFSDVHFYSQPILHDQKQLNLNVSLHRGSGQFEVLDGDSKVATGYIVMILESSIEDDNKPNKNYNIDSNEVYEHLRSRGYSYKEGFRSIDCIDVSMTGAQIAWNDNWVTFIDGLLQFNALRCSYEGVSQPTQLRDLTIDVDKHTAHVLQNSTTGNDVVRAEVDEIFDNTRCGGILLQNLKFRNLPFLNQDIFKLRSSALADSEADFVPKEKLTEGKNFALQIGNIGELETLHWEEAPAITEDGVQVLVEYAGINILDVKRATGSTLYEETEKFYGMDFSGLTRSGERVMGLVRNGAASTVVSARPELLWPVPAHWSLEEAATVPLAYTQAFYYLCIKNELQRGWKVLIHGAAGALGQAAISIALAHGCKVFATVSDGAKKKFLLKLFPELNEDVIGNSRNDSFGDMVLNATNGEGCKIIISCVRDDLKNISLKCAAFSGVTIDMVQIQNRDKFEYGMFNMTKQRSYIAADFYSVLDSGKTEIFKKLQMLVSDGVSRGYVRPLSRVTFAPTEAARAFRLLAASRHRGRVLLRLRDPLLPVTPRIICSSDSVQLIVWDGSSFGLQLADRLISRGAKKLRIYCLNPIPQHLLKLRLWKETGVDVEIISEQLSDSNTISKLLNKTDLRACIEGIYVSVTNVDEKRDGAVEKIIGDLDFTSRKSMPLLKYFAVISGDSNVGQQICLSRSKDGLPALALSLPAYKQENNGSGAAIEESVWNRSAIDITELGLRSKHPVLFAQMQAMEPPSLIKLIPALAKSVNENATLKDLGLGEYLPSIQFFLRDVYHVSLDDKKVIMLTKEKIMEIEMNAIEGKFKEVKGLGTFFSTECHDELRATSELIPMNTLVFNTEMMEGAIDASRAQLFIVPGLEGLHSRFRTLCARLKLPALALQPGLDRPRETPAQLATRYSKILLEEFQLQTNFYLLGYEFGIIVALELAAILEDHGLTGTVYCIGDGPEEMKILLESELRLFNSETALQEGLCKHMFALMTHDSISMTALERDLRDCSFWHERVDACVRSLLGRVPQSAQYIRSLLEATYARISGARRAEYAPRALRSRLVLLRARREGELEGERARDSCSLQRYSRQPLHVRDLGTPMAYAADDLRAPAIINQYLDKDLLEEYNNSNICYTYLI